jgi:oxygen-dependent protoporphyrinogen oxidase
VSHRVVVIGGGISGLAAAHAITTSGRDVHLTLLEASERLGGNVKTDTLDGFVIEHGPDSFVTSKPAGIELCRQLGLESSFITTPEENRVVFFAHRGTLVPLPEGLTLGVPTRLMPFLRTPLLSLAGKLRALCEPFVPVLDSAEDESVQDFFTRRLGKEVAERLAAPLLGGVYAGDARSLSMEATFPQFRELERRHGSFMLGLLLAKRRQAGAPSDNPFHALELLFTKQPPREAAFISLRQGMGGLIDALAAALPDGSIVKNAAVVAIEPSSETPRYRVRLASGESLDADAVIVATPVQQSTQLAPDPEIKAALAQVHTVSTATVAFGFARSAVTHPLKGLGFIVPKGEGKILAATWVSSKWPNRAPEGNVLVRAFVGGPSAQEQTELPDAEIAALALSELRRLMGRLDEPSFFRVHRYVGASPQPELGHAARMHRVHEREKALPGLYFAAGGLDGIGIPDSIKYAQKAAQRLLDDLR